MTDPRIYHFTHVENLRSLLDAGALFADSHPLCRTATQVGSAGIKDRRRGQPVPCGPCGHVGDYVPFYFAPRSPMLFTIYKQAIATRAGSYEGGEQPLIYLVTSVNRVVDAGLRWVATDGNAAHGATSMTDDREALESIVDWPLMGDKIWRNTDDDPDRMRRRAAEFLVHEHVPMAVVIGIWRSR